MLKKLHQIVGSIALYISDEIFKIPLAQTWCELKFVGLNLVEWSKSLKFLLLLNKTGFKHLYPEPTGHELHYDFLTRVFFQLTLTQEKSGKRKVRLMSVYSSILRSGTEHKLLFPFSTVAEVRLPPKCVLCPF